MKHVLKHASAAILEGALLSALVVGLIAGSALAAKGGGGAHGKPGGGSATGTLAVEMVEDANGNGTPNFNDTITFRVTSSTASPYVTVTCRQNGTLVYSASAGFYADYPWPGARNMPLYSPSWSSGAADCTAVITNTSVKLTFRVNA